MRAQLQRLWHDESGTVATETALLLAVFSMGAVAAVVGFAERLTDYVQGAMDPAAGEGKTVGVAMDANSG